MSLTERIDEYVRAAFSGIWITSHEKLDAINELSELCRRESWDLATWNISTGLNIHGQGFSEDVNDPLAAVQAASGLADSSGRTLLVLEDFHHFLQSPEIISAVERQVMAGKQNGVSVIVLSAMLRIPAELEKLFVVVRHELPSRDQLGAIAREVATDEGELPIEDELDRVLDAATGLTRLEAENVFALSIVRHSRLEPQTLWTQKSQMLEKSGTLHLYQGDANFESLGGLHSLKAFVRRSLARSSRRTGNVRARGVMLLSPPGCGKSEFCKALGNEVGRPVLQLDVGSLMGSLVGQSEERTRKALAIVDAMAPCVLMIDEVEKAFAGVAGSGTNDSGVSARMFGTVLAWLNDHESDVFVVCTANDVSKLPPEFSRSERFDATFFVDLPTRAEKDSIWSMYQARFGIDPNQELPEDTDWTGAEIKAACRLSVLLDVPLRQASQNVVPIAVTAAESIDRLRSWAARRCLDANRGGVYQTRSKKPRRRRSVSCTKPSTN